MGVSKNRGGPNIDPNSSRALLMSPNNRAPIYEDHLSNEADVHGCSPNTGLSKYPGPESTPNSRGLIQPVGVNRRPILDDLQNEVAAVSRSSSRARVRRLHPPGQGEQGSSKSLSTVYGPSRDLNMITLFGLWGNLAPLPWALVAYIILALWGH